MLVPFTFRDNRSNSLRVINLYVNSNWRPSARLDLVRPYHSALIPVGARCNYTNVKINTEAVYYQLDTGYIDFIKKGRGSFKIHSLRILPQSFIYADVIGEGAVLG